MTATGLPRSIVFLLAALAALVLSLLGSGVFLLVSPRTTDAASAWIAVACLVAAGMLAVLTRLLLRGKRAAWLLTCVVSGVVLAASAAAAIYAFADSPEGVRVGDSIVVVQTKPTLLDSAGNASPLIVVGAVWAIALLLLPGTRRDLRLRD